MGEEDIETAEYEFRLGMKCIGTQRLHGCARNHSERHLEEPGPYWHKRTKDPTYAGRTGDYRPSARRIASNTTAPLDSGTPGNRRRRTK